MKIPQVARMVSGQVVADSSNFATVLTTDWMLAAGGSALTLLQEIRRLTGAGSLTSAVRHRFAAVSTERPGTWTTSANERTSADIYGEEVSLTGTTDQMWVQIGLAAKTASGVSECLAKVGGSVQGNGTLVATQTVQVTPINNSGQYVYVPLGKMFPHTGLTKLMYAIVFSGVSGTITYRPVFREIGFNPDYPTDWSNLASADQTETGNNDVNLNTSMTFSPTAGRMYGQAGIKFSGDARGTLKIAVAAIF
jgi:hypothetical protein